MKFRVRFDDGMIDMIGWLADNVGQPTKRNKQYVHAATWRAFMPVVTDNGFIQIDDAEQSFLFALTFGLTAQCK